MSFLSGITDIVSKVVEVAAPIALAAVFPPAALMPAASNMVTSLLGQGLSDVIGQLGKQGSLPNFVMNKAQDLIGQVVSQLLQPADKGCSDHVHDKCGDAFGSLVERMMKDFKDAFSNYQNEQCKNGSGKGGCGKPGTGGSTGGNGPVGFRELASLLAQLEEKQAKNVKTAVQDASKALGIDKKEEGAEAKQFEALEASKAEAQLMSMVSSMVSEVLSKVGQGLNTAANAK